MKKHQAIASLLLAVTVSLWACARPKPQVPVGASPPAKVSEPAAQEPGDLNKRIVAALQRGLYADAVLLARQAKVPKPESDFAIGEIILQGHMDESAAQSPQETIEEALELVEAAALAEHQPAISSLAATFSTGLRRKVTDAFLLKPSAALNQCWENAKTKPQMARSCVDMRRKHQHREAR